MKRRLLVVWLLLLAVLGGFAMCGSAGYRKGYAGGYGSQAGYVRGGVGSSAWDTVTVMLFTDARVDSVVNGRHYWLFRPVVQNRTNRDIDRVADMNAAIMGTGAYSWRDDRSDTARAYRLGTGNAIPTFAYGQIDSTHAAGFMDASALTQSMYAVEKQAGVTQTILNLRPNHANAKFQLLYIPFTSVIPANSTVVSAKIVYTAASTMYYGVADSIIATLMTNPNDNQWYKQKGISNYPDWAETGWSRQNVSTWGGSDAYPWNPDLKLRTRLWHWGKISDWTGSTRTTSDAAGDTLTGARRQYQTVDVNITNCVQAAVAGAVNNGILISSHVSASGASTFTTSLWDRDHANIRRRHPYVVIKYITKRYQPAFGNAEWSFTFQSDDGKLVPNNMWADTLATYGGKMTMYVAGNQLDYNSGANVSATVNQLLGWHDSGNEIGSHSKWHAFTQQYVKRMNSGAVGAARTKTTQLTGANDGAHNIGSAAYDSLVVDTDPVWMYTKADSLGRDMRNDPYYGKSFGVPTAQLGGYYQRALIDHGYASIRGLATNLTYDREKYYVPPASFDLSAADSMMSGAPTQYGTHVRNMRIIVPWDGPLALCGPDSSRTDKYASHLDSVQINVERSVFTHIGNNTRSMVLFAHDRKTHNGNAPSQTPPGLDNTGVYNTLPNVASGNLDADELGVMCRVVRSWNGRYMTSRELVDWYAAGATAIDHPFNASRSDTFQIDAYDRAWYKPDGVDNRWIRGVRQRSAAVAFDVTDPDAPTNLASAGARDYVQLVWNASTSTDVASYKVYRYFDGAAATLIASNVQALNYRDNTAINGSQHNYYVTAVDGAGRESVASTATSATPGYILAMQRPVYWSFWFQDPNVTAFPQATIDSLSAFDAIITGPFPLELPATEPAYTAGGNLIDKIRAKNADEMLLTYISTATIPSDEQYPSGSAIRRIYDYCAAHNGFAKDVNGDIVESDVYPVRFYNVSSTTLADTIASILADVYSRSGVNGEYSGFFIDDSDTTLPNWICNGGNCQSIMDFDQSGENFIDGESVLVRDFNIDFLRSLRREFAQRGMKNRLLVANTTFGRKEDYNLKDEEYMGLLDGALNEGYNWYGYPGHWAQADNETTDQTTWYNAMLWRTLLTRAQTSPPLMLWEAKVDSSAQFMNEVLAGAYGGWVGAQTDGDWRGATHAPTMKRRLPDRGIGSVSFGHSAGSADTLKFVSGNYVHRMILNEAYADSFAVWPYIVFNKAAHDTLSRSRYWERNGDQGPPDAVAIEVSDTEEHDNQSVLVLYPSYDSDASHYNIYRYDNTGSHLFDTMQISSPRAKSRWYDTTAKNGSTYGYHVTVVDFMGNESDESNFVTDTPADNTTPPAPSGVMASGGPGCVVLDWDTSGTPDFANYKVYRKPLLGGEYALMATRIIRTNSFLNDSTAVASSGYWYKITQTDDDANTSNYSSEVRGGWSAPNTSAPTNLAVNANTPSGQQASLSWDDPSDLTGFVRYRVYRDTTLPLTFADKRDSTDASPWVDTAATYGTKFYYEVKALYTGGLSAATNTVENTNIQGFATLRPDLQTAVGNGTTGIDLNWSDLPNTALYRVWRKPPSSAYAKIDSTVNSYYTDTSAAQATAYDYFIVAKDGLGALSAKSDTISASWTAASGGNPAIASQNGGTLNNGESITLTGTNFGTKPANGTGGAGPIKWDSFEGGTNGSLLYQVQSEWVPYATGISAMYSTADKHSGSMCATDGPYDAAHEGTTNYFDTGSQTELFVSYWQKFANFDKRDGDSGTLKLCRLAASGGGGRYNGSGVTAVGPVTDEVTGNPAYDNAGYLYYNEGSASHSTNYFPDGQAVVNSWFRVDTYKKLSTPGGTNGETWATVIASNTAATRGFWNVMTRAAGNYWTLDTILLGTEQYNKKGSWQAYEDDFYIDNTLARVELGNATTLAASTHREMQIPTLWSSGSITVNVNTGTFSNGPAYLFVVKSDGTVSAGHAVTISN